ncbi:hypothetical protein ACFL1H_05350 [Nanoarchaeota archaeon]
MIKLLKNYVFERATPEQVIQAYDKFNFTHKSNHLKEREIIKKEENENILKTIIRYSAHSKVPKQFRNIIKKEWLTWDEIGILNKISHVYDYHINHNFLKNKFSCKGRVLRLKRGENTVQKLFGFLTINIPIFGKLIENAIKKSLYEEMDKNYFSIRRLI